MKTEAYRKIIVVLMLGIFFLGVSSPHSLAAIQPAPGKDTIADAFLGEALTYQIGFWAFDNVAVGKISLKRGADGDYVATLSANTTGGFLTWLLSGRHDIYVEHLRLSDDGKRFISKTFEKNVVTANKKKESVITIDYAKGIMTSRNLEDGQETTNNVIPLQKGILYDGPLAAFYNLRFGAYGPFQMGREFNIYTFPKKDNNHVPVIHVRLAGQKETDKKLSGNFLHEYFAEVKLDKDLFGSKAGDVEIVFSNDRVPEEAVAKDIVFFGDVRGKLTAMGTGLAFAIKPAAAR